MVYSEKQKMSWCQLCFGDIAMVTAFATSDRKVGIMMTLSVYH